jgi:hypothetical protein
MEKFSIYQFNPNCQEWKDITSSSLKDEAKEAAIDACVKKIGKQLTLQEYFNIPDRESNSQKGVCYRMIGKPTNILEELALSEQEQIWGLEYCNFREDFTEDICEDETEWDRMRDYANGLAYFINRLKGEIGSGKLKYE